MRVADSAVLTPSLDSKHGKRRRRLHEIQFDIRHRWRRRHCVVGESRGGWLTELVVGVFFIERIAKTIGESADDLSLDQKRVHAGSAVSDNRVIEHVDTANLRIDCNDSGVCGISKDAGVVRLMSGSGRQTGRL